MFLLTIIIFAQVPIGKGAIYAPEIDAVLGPAGLSDKGLWLCQVRVADGNYGGLLKGTILTIEPLAKTCQLTDGRARIALRPGSYLFRFQKGEYQTVEKRVRIVPDQIAIVNVVLSMPEEVFERKKRKARIDSLMIEGIDRFNHDSLDQARQLFMEVLAIDSTYSDALQYLKRIDEKIEGIITICKEDAAALEKAGKYREAISKLTLALSYDSTRTDLKEDIKRLEDKIRKPKRKAIPKERVEAWYREGVQAFTNGEYEKARRLFKRVLGYNPKHSGAKRYLKRAEARIGLK